MGIDGVSKVVHCSSTNWSMESFPTQGDMGNGDSFSQIFSFSCVSHIGVKVTSSIFLLELGGDSVDGANGESR